MMTVRPFFMVFKCMISILSDLKHTNDTHFIPLTHFHHSHQETPTITQRLMSQSSLVVTQRAKTPLF